MALVLAALRVDSLNYVTEIALSWSLGTCPLLITNVSFLFGFKIKTNYIKPKQSNLP